MKKLNILLTAIISATILLSCGGKEPDGFVKKMIEPWRELDHPLYYMETIDNRTAIYRIPGITNEIFCLIHDLKNVHDIKATGTSVYILRDDKRGHATVSRLESDRTMLTETDLSSGLTLADKPVWAAAWNDRIFIAGTDSDGVARITEVEFRRHEPEETYRMAVSNDPDITWEEREWFSTDKEISAIRTSREGDILAVMLNSETGNELFLVDAPGESPRYVNEYTPVELGDFSPDGKQLAVVFNLNNRDDLFMLDVSSGQHERITTSAQDYTNAHPVWHPSGEYLMYTTNYTTEFKENATRLKGEQLYLYSMISRHARRLTALPNKSMWVDFCANGDFLLYQTTPGTPARHGEVIPEDQEGDGEKETRTVYYVRWDHEEFVTSRRELLPDTSIQILMSWVSEKKRKIDFIWGPGGEWIPPENR